MLKMDIVEMINRFLDASLGERVVVPELGNETVCILKPESGKAHYEAYKKYFTILKFNVLDQFWTETPENEQRYQKMLEAALVGDKSQFLSLAKAMEKNH